MLWVGKAWRKHLLNSRKAWNFPYWTNSMFGGMPAYQIMFETPNKISIGYLHNYLSHWVFRNLSVISSWPA